MAKEEIEKLREKIDSLDDRLLRLLKERLSICEQIGIIKSVNQINIFDSQREELLFSSLEKKCKDLNMDKEFVRNLWKVIINQSHLLQKKTS
jgi:chorismate mutase/prephenate dehydrogenase